MQHAQCASASTETHLTAVETQQAEKAQGHKRRPLLKYMTIMRQPPGSFPGPLGAVCAPSHGIKAGYNNNSRIPTPAALSAFQMVNAAQKFWAAHASRPTLTGSYRYAVGTLSDDDLAELRQDCSNALNGNEAARLAFTLAGGAGAVTAIYDFGATGAAAASAMGASMIADMISRKIDQRAREEQERRCNE